MATEIVDSTCPPERGPVAVFEPTLHTGGIIQRGSDNAAARSAVPSLTIEGLESTRPTAQVGDSYLAVQDASRTREIAEAQPATQATREAVHSNLLQTAQNLVADLNRSNHLGEQLPRAVAESTLRVLSLGFWRGTGITQHGNWQQEREARRVIVTPSVDSHGVVQLTPQQWANCFRDVQEHRDSLNRKWANCSEQAASLAHVIHSMINDPNDRRMAGLQVRQAYGQGHSWVEVQYPNGPRIVYDPWARMTGRVEDMPARYRQNVHYTRSFGRTTAAAAR